LTSPQTLSAGTYSYSYVDLDSNDAVLVSGDVTLYVSEYFKLDSNARFVTTCSACKITIYIDGTPSQGAPPALALDSNSLLSANAKPTQLKVYVTGSGTTAKTVDFDSNSTFYGTLDAPLSAVDLNSNNHFYGAVIGKTINLDSNAFIHYDTALTSSATGGGGLAQLKSWREL
jgi:hypothetical protein